MSAPFHAGELAVQERAGVRERVAGMGERMIRDAMPEQHRELFEKLPMLLVGSLDDGGRPWASVLVGAPGFVRAPDARQLHVGARPGFGDPLAGHLAPGRPLGLLGLEPHTRRRNRMNGTVAAVDEAGFVVDVDQSYGNCPQYIQAREPYWRRPADTFGDPRPVHLLDAHLDAAPRRLLQRADTLFIATASAHAAGHAGAEGVDVSHRGGRPGFVRVEGDDRGRIVLTLPDFRGNNLFNTLGNIAARPHAGVLAMDPANGDLLQLTGRAEIVWDGAELRSFAGAQRLLRIAVDEALWHPRALPLVWSAPEMAPQLAATGAWGQPVGEPGA
jgi:predicted pyridoxine 5'-phosphate oxidase superfamily flavin-nucleotide-binding protein